MVLAIGGSKQVVFHRKWPLTIARSAPGSQDAPKNFAKAGYRVYSIAKLSDTISKCRADVAELVDALDLGSSVLVT